MSSSSGALSALAAAPASNALATPARTRDAVLTPTPATVLPAQEDDASDELELDQVAQRKDQMALLTTDLDVVLQHGRLLHEWLQREGMHRQTIHLQIAQLQRELDDAADNAARREAALEAEIQALQAREASARAQVGRSHDESLAHDEEVKSFEARIAEQAALAAAANAEAERSKQALSAQTSVLNALRDECDSAQRELSALQASVAERERQYSARESSLEARAAELADALAVTTRAAESKGKDAEGALATLDAVRAELSRERAARQAVETAHAQLSAELERIEGAQGGAGGSAGVGDPSISAAAAAAAAAEETIARLQAQLEHSEERARAFSADADALRAERASAAREPGGLSAEQFLIQAVCGSPHAAALSSPSANGAQPPVGTGGGAAGGAELEGALQQLEAVNAKLAEQHELITQLRSDRAALKLELDAETKVGRGGAWARAV
jgi:chromosome segregation ATPase